MKKFFCATLLMAAAALGADLSGKWTGTLQTQEGNEAGAAVLNLKQTESAVTGTAGPSEEEQIPISNAKVDGDKLTFDVKTERFTFQLNLVAEGDTMKGTATRVGEGEQHPPVNLQLKRVK